MHTTNNKIKLLPSDRIYLGIVYVILIISLVLVLYPLIYIVSASLSNPQYINSGEMWLWPKGFNLFGYESIFASKDIWMGYKNTIIYTVIGTTVNLAFTIPCAYALSREDFMFRNFLTNMMVFTMFVGGGLIPTYLLIKKLGMLDTIWALILPGAASVYNIVVTRTFFQTTIPVELEEAAFIDGATDWQVFRQIVLPLAMPIIAVMALFYGVGHWNSYFDALIYISDRSKYPLQMILREILVLQDMSSTATTQAMSSSMAEMMLKKEQIAGVIKYGVMIVSTLPVIVVYPFLQKYFVQGVMIGSVKG